MWDNLSDVGNTQNKRLKRKEKLARRAQKDAIRQTSLTSPASPVDDMRPGVLYVSPGLRKFFSEGPGVVFDGDDDDQDDDDEGAAVSPDELAEHIAKASRAS